MPRFGSAPLLLAILACSSARAEDSAALEAKPPARPISMDVQALVGAEFQGNRGNPVAFGVSGELLWRARVGVFAGLLSSEGSPILPVANGKSNLPSLADRISVPFGLAARPFLSLAKKQQSWLGRFAQELGVQVGMSVEHIRTSDDSQTWPALHLGLNIDLPLIGSPDRGGLALRLYGRLIVTSEVRLDTKQTQTVFEPATALQLYGGLCYFL